MEAYPFSPHSSPKKDLAHNECVFSFILLRNKPKSLDKLVFVILAIFNFLANSFASIKVSFKLFASTKQ